MHFRGKKEKMKTQYKVNRYLVGVARNSTSQVPWLVFLKLETEKRLFPWGREARDCVWPFTTDTLLLFCPGWLLVQRACKVDKDWCPLCHTIGALGLFLADNFYKALDIGIGGSGFGSLLWQWYLMLFVSSLHVTQQDVTPRNSLHELWSVMRVNTIICMVDAQTVLLTCTNITNLAGLWTVTCR